MFTAGSMHNTDKAILCPKSNHVNRIITVQVLINRDRQIKTLPNVNSTECKDKKNILFQRSLNSDSTCSCLFPSATIPRQPQISNICGFPVVSSFANRGICFYVFVIFNLYTHTHKKKTSTFARGRAVTESHTSFPASSIFLRLHFYRLLSFHVWRYSATQLFCSMQEWTT
jgi:hypothetical protein